MQSEDTGSYVRLSIDEYNALLEKSRDAHAHTAVEKPERKPLIAAMIRKYGVDGRMEVEASEVYRFTDDRADVYQVRDVKHDRFVWVLGSAHT